MCNIKLATQTIAHITVADALKINVLNTKPLPPGLPLGALPQTPVIGSRSRAHHRCVYY